MDTALLEAADLKIEIENLKASAEVQTLQALRKVHGEEIQKQNEMFNAAQAIKVQELKQMNSSLNQMDSDFNVQAYNNRIQTDATRLESATLTTALEKSDIGVNKEEEKSRRKEGRSNTRIAELETKYKDAKDANIVMQSDYDAMVVAKKGADDERKEPCNRGNRLQVKVTELRKSNADLQAQETSEETTLGRIEQAVGSAVSEAVPAKNQRIVELEDANESLQQGRAADWAQEQGSLRTKKELRTEKSEVESETNARHIISKLMRSNSKATG